MKRTTQIRHHAHKKPVDRPEGARRTLKPGQLSSDGKMRTATTVPLGLDESSPVRSIGLRVI